MNWEEINSRILEVSEQIQSFSSKQLEILELTTIIQKRQQSLDRNEDIRRQNNAILENKMKVTPIQTLLLKKLKELSLSSDMNEIYKNIPDSLEECSIFLKQLREKYHLGERIIDMVEEIEKLTEVEYSNNFPFEETEYAKLIIFEDNILEELLKNDIVSPSLTNKVLLEALVESKINLIIKYLHNLSSEKKKELFLQFIELSYDKNSFLFFQELKVLKNICQDLKTMPLLEGLYDNFHSMLKETLLEKHINNQTEEPINNLDIDLDNILKQELKMKKKV